MKTCTIVAVLCLALPLAFGADEPVIVDHECMELPQVPMAWVQAAKDYLYIAYGHTSHGSQVTSGMTGLETFIGGCGGPEFEWNDYGTGNTLHLDDYAMGGDCGYYPQWVNNTIDYLDDPSNAGVNVIIWSWCGQHAGYTQQDMITKYLDPMTQLESDYPDVSFVYMTGHLNYWQKTNTDARNQQIRDHCIASNKILYDFASIESYNPDGVYFEYANDDCSYWDAYGVYQGNWAEEWQNTHVKDVEWYDCGAAHSKPLNSNQKAYAAWWLWARLAGWPGPDPAGISIDNDTISAAAGGAVNFHVDAGPQNAGRSYFLLGSVSGAKPGFPLPGGHAVLPVEWDIFTGIVLQMANTPMFSGFEGVLDGTGSASATLDTLGPVDPVMEGFVLYFAYALYYPWDYVSDPVAVLIEP